MLSVICSVVLLGILSGILADTHTFTYNYIFTIYIYYIYNYIYIFDVLSDASSALLPGIYSMLTFYLAHLRGSSELFSSLVTTSHRNVKFV